MTPCRSAYTAFCTTVAEHNTVSLMHHDRQHPYLKIPLKCSHVCVSIFCHIFQVKTMNSHSLTSPPVIHTLSQSVKKKQTSQSRQQAGYILVCPCVLD